jgi:hypothetical protein
VFLTFSFAGALNQRALCYGAEFLLCALEPFRMLASPAELGIGQVLEDAHQSRRCPCFLCEHLRQS